MSVFTGKNFVIAFCLSFLFPAFSSASTDVVLEIHHIEAGALHQEITSALEESGIHPDSVTHLVISGEAPLLYEDCRILRPLIKEARHITEHDIFKDFFPQLRMLDLSRAVFEENSLPDNPPQPVLYRSPLGTVHMTVHPYPGAFQGLRNLERIIFPASLKKIGSFAFYDCINLQKIVWANHLKELGTAAFGGCESLKLRFLPKSIVRISRGAFVTCMKMELEELPPGITEIDRAVFLDCKNLRLKFLPEGLEHIEDLAFRGCTQLDLEKLPSGLKTIGKEAFYFCKNLRLTELPDSLTWINDAAFAGTQLNVKTLPPGLSVINRQVFRNCRISKLTIHGNIKEIKEDAFARNNLEEVVFESPVPPQIDIDAFAENGENIRFKFPPESREAYEKVLGQLKLSPLWRPWQP